MGVCKTTSIGLAVASLGFLSATTHAATRDWAESNGAMMSQAKAWKSLSMPGKKDVARFNLSSAYTIKFKSNVSNLGLLIGDDKLVFDFDRCIYTLSPTRRNSVYLGLAKSDVARVTFQNGKLKSGPGTIGGVAGSFGNVTLSTGGIWNSSGLVAVGGYGSGGLTVIGGGKLASGSGTVGAYTKSKGNVLLSGSGSQWNVASNLAVGGKASTGLVTIRDNASLGVGNKLDISKSSTVKLSGGALLAGSIVRPGSILFQSGTLGLTKSDLTIGAGGVLGGNVILNAKRNLNVSQNVSIDGSSTLDLNGGRFSAGRTQSLGVINIRGGEFHGTLVNGINSPFVEYAEGVSPRQQVNITAPSFVFTDDVENNGSLNVSSGSQVRFEGNVSGSQGFTGGGQITFAGTYNPSSVYGVVFSGSNIIFDPGAHLQLDIAAPVRTTVRNGELLPVIAYGPSDQLVVNGRIYLTNVDVALKDATRLQLGDAFDLVTGSITYDPNFRINLPTLPGGLRFDVTRGPDSLGAVIIPEPTIGSVLGAAVAALAFRRPRRQQ